MALSLNPHCLSALGELSQRDAHQEGRSPEGAGPGGAGDPHKEVSSSSGDQSSSGAWVGAGPKHLGTEPWGAVAEPVELAQPPWSQAAVVMVVPEQVEQNPVDAAATAAVAAASKAAPAAVAGTVAATTSGIWGSPSPGWGAVGWDRPHHLWVPPLGQGSWQEREPLLVVQNPLLRIVVVQLGWLRSCHCWRYWYCHHHSPGWELEPHLEWGWIGKGGTVSALLVLSLVSGLVRVEELEVQNFLWGLQVAELGQEQEQVGQQALL